MSEEGESAGDVGIGQAKGWDTCKEKSKTHQVNHSPAYIDAFVSLLTTRNAWHCYRMVLVLVLTSDMNEMEN